MEVTESGIVNVVRREQFQNAQSPMEETELGIVKSSRSGNESFLTYFRFLSSHTTVRAVRHTAV